MAFVLLSCDKGLSPVTVQPPGTGIGGTIHYVSSWPPRDSIYELWVAAIPKLPEDSSENSFVQDYFNGTIKLSDTLSRFDDSGSVRAFKIVGMSPQTYDYVGVIQQYGPSYTDLRVIGIYGYSTTHPFPSPVTVTEGASTDGLEIVVDFKNIPPQPFKP